MPSPIFRTDLPIDGRSDRGNAKCVRRHKNGYFSLQVQHRGLSVSRVILLKLRGVWTSLTPHKLTCWSVIMAALAGCVQRPSTG